MDSRKENLIIFAPSYRGKCFETAYLHTAVGFLNDSRVVCRVLEQRDPHADAEVIDVHVVKSGKDKITMTPREIVSPAGIRFTRGRTTGGSISDLTLEDDGISFCLYGNSTSNRPDVVGHSTYFRLTFTPDIPYIAQSLPYRNP